MRLLPRVLLGLHPRIPLTLLLTRILPALLPLLTWILLALLALLSLPARVLLALLRLLARVLLSSGTLTRVALDRVASRRILTAAGLSVPRLVPLRRTLLLPVSLLTIIARLVALTRVAAAGVLAILVLRSLVLRLPIGLIPVVARITLRLIPLRRIALIVSRTVGLLALQLLTIVTNPITALIWIPRVLLLAAGILLAPVLVQPIAMIGLLLPVRLTVTRLPRIGILVRPLNRIATIGLGSRLPLLAVQSIVQTVRLTVASSRIAVSAFEPSVVAVLTIAVLTIASLIIAPLVIAPLDVALLGGLLCVLLLEILLLEILLLGILLLVESGPVTAIGGGGRGPLLGCERVEVTAVGRVDSGAIDTSVPQGRVVEVRVEVVVDPVGGGLLSGKPFGPNGLGFLHQVRDVPTIGIGLLPVPLVRRQIPVGRERVGRVDPIRIRLIRRPPGVGVQSVLQILDTPLRHWRRCGDVRTRLDVPERQLAIHSGLRVKTVLNHRITVRALVVRVLLQRPRPSLLLFRPKNTAAFPVVSFHPIDLSHRIRQRRASGFGGSGSNACFGHPGRFVDAQSAQSGELALHRRPNLRLGDIPFLFSRHIRQVARLVHEIGCDLPLVLMIGPVQPCEHLIERQSGSVADPQGERSGSRGNCWVRRSTSDRPNAGNELVEPSLDDESIKVSYRECLCDPLFKLAYTGFAERLHS